MDKKKKIRLGIIAGGLIGALTITFLYSAEGSLPDTDESKTLWKCTACAKTFELTAREAARAQRKAGGVPIACRHCDEVKAYQVMACPRCGTLFFGSEVPGHDGHCPKCRVKLKRHRKKAKPEENVKEEPAVETPEKNAEPANKADKGEAGQQPKKHTRTPKKQKDQKKKKKKKPTPKSL